METPNWQQAKQAHGPDPESGNGFLAVFGLFMSVLWNAVSKVLISAEAWTSDPVSCQAKGKSSLRFCLPK